MSQTRIYLPLNASGVRALADTRTLEQAPMAAFAVTDRLERDQPEGDEEAWEFAALCDAVDAASELREGPQDKRIVAAADVDPSWVGPVKGEGTEVLSAVEVSGPVGLEQVVAFHIDESAGADGVDDLLWYDATELRELLRLL